MLRKLQALICLACFFLYAHAATMSIGTVSVRGDMRVDGKVVKGNATLFEGSTVETGLATADLRLGKGTQVTLGSNSIEATYGDHLVLQRGKTEFAASGSFRMLANGLRITATDPKSRGVISMDSGNTVKVSSIHGQLEVTNDKGVLMANIQPGLPLSFAFQSAAESDAFTAVGKVSFENGHYYLTVKDTGAKFEITGNDLGKLVGKTAKVKGKVVSGTIPAGSAGVVAVTTAQVLIAGAVTAGTAIIGGVAVAAATGTAVGLYEDNKSSASR